MKKKSLLMVLSVILMFGCTVGVKKDLMTGLKITNKNLSYEDAYLSSKNQKLSNPELPMNAEVNLVILGMSGFMEKNGKVYIGAAITVTDKEQKKIIEYPDLFASYDSTGISPTDAKQITLTLTTGSPMTTGTKYLWKSRIWDKNGKGELMSELEVTIK